MKLYYNPLSPNVRRVRLTAAILDMKLEEELLDLSKGEHKAPGYLALNPNGAVPTLVDGDFVLTESRAIMQYLASTKPQAGLLPRQESLRADVARWQFWDAAHFSPQLQALAFEKIIKGLTGTGQPDTRKIQDALTNFSRYAHVLNQRLTGRSYVVGDALSIADLTLVSSLMYAQQTAVPIADFPQLRAWYLRLTELEAWKKTAPDIIPSVRPPA